MGERKRKAITKKNKSKTLQKRLNDEDANISTTETKPHNSNTTFSHIKPKGNFSNELSMKPATLMWAQVVVR